MSTVLSVHRFHVSVLAAGALALVLSTSLISRAPAQDSTAADVENAKFQFAGTVNSNAVYVRSGPSENDYPVLKLDKGATLTVVGKRFDWLKIVPPDGSFCYVAKAYVDRRGDGTIGRVTNKLNVRIGSTLNAMKTKLAMQLEPGVDVTILGDQDEYFKIKPPEGVFLYVNAQFADPLKSLTPATPVDSGALPMAEGQPVPQRATDADGGGMTDVASATPATQPDGTAMNPSTDDPSTTGAPMAAAATASPTASPTGTPSTGPSTQPAMTAASVEAEFDALEITYGEMIKKPLDEQDIPSMIDGYQKVATSGMLPETLRRVCDAKTAMLKGRLKDREDFMAFKKHQEEVSQRQLALNAERDELEQRLKATDMKYFTAVGVLRPSSLQQGQVVLYRLTDPGTGRTLVYIRSDDNKIGVLLGQFIGVKGQIANDAQLNLQVISPEKFEVCDQSKLFTNIAAQIVPPSLMPGGTGTATTGNE